MASNQILKALKTRTADDMFVAQYGPKEKWIAAQCASGLPKNEAEKKYRRLRKKAVADKAAEMDEVAKRFRK